MITSSVNGPVGGDHETRRLPRHIVVLGIISFLTAMSSAMVYGLLPVFLITVLHATMAAVGVIEGVAVATMSLAKIVSGIASDCLGRRKPIILLGYALSALNKLMFPLAGDASAILVARVVDRVGKGIRDAPRDAFLTDVTPAAIRGSGFGLRLAFYTSGYVVGPLAAIGLMKLSRDNFRFVFWVAVIPAAMAIIVLLVALKEAPKPRAAGAPSLRIRFNDLGRFSSQFWWALAIAGLLSVARFSQAFLVLKMHDIGIDAAFVPIVLVLMHVVYACAAFPFGVLADYGDRRLQLGIGAIVLICTDLILAGSDSFWLTALGAALWGLQMGMTQGLLSAIVANAAPENLRGTAFGIYELTTGLAMFVASVAAGGLWMVGGPSWTFGASAIVTGTVVLLLLFRPIPKGISLSPRP